MEYKVTFNYCGEVKEMIFSAKSVLGVIEQYSQLYPILFIVKIELISDYIY